MPPEFQVLLLEASDALITGDKPAMHQFFIPLSLYQRKNTAVNKCQLHFGNEGGVLPYSALVNNCVTNQYLSEFRVTIIAISLQGPRNSTLHLDNHCGTTLQMKENFKCIQSYRWVPLKPYSG